ncbi:two-component response regulator [Microseira wollei NIES-4236]|uniref:Two-component response regulator n=1 Tax=Microseira wollei NIES-4236 TaxID=2530354 RepID=A0AAV3XK48_9CYAN|nr:two-component response regulator [Microseira wollei NIES-4236]
MANKILVIDDSLSVRKQVQAMLPKGNFQVLEAKDGQEGLKLINQERPNLIMLDFLMPKMNGLEVYKQLQSKPELQKIPLVIMSGRREEVLEKIPEPAFNKYFEFILKPFEQKDLIAGIQSAMKKAKLPREAAPAKAAEPAPAAPAAPAAAPAAADGAGAAEIQALKQQIAKMQAEIEALKKQQAQIMAFIKSKLK